MYEKWLESDFGINNSLGYELLDINAKVFMGGSMGLSKQNKKFFFNSPINFDWANVPFIKNSKGRITVKIDTYKGEKSFFIPIIVSRFKTKESMDPKIVKKHSSVGETFSRYERELKEYHEKLGIIYDKRDKKNKIDKKKCGDDCIDDIEILEDVFYSLDELEKDDKYIFYEEDLEEKKLEKKYKEAIEWAGPMLRGRFWFMNGFRFVVHSNDHYKHFHVIHKARGIDARFSFPNIKLMNYKSNKNTISSKEEKAIINCFKNPEVLDRLKQEFQKRESK